MLLYIHIPFCDSKCFYCSFNSYTDLFHLKQTYMEAILVQLKNDFEEFDVKTNSITSVFFGGGTPSSVEAKFYESIFKFLENYLIKNCEITFEANPNSATLSWLKDIKNLGANRISFGVQSFNDKKLKYLGRAHDNNGAIEALKNAKLAGFEKINADIIYGVYGDSIDLINQDIKIINDLGISHISAYSLTLEEGTNFENKSYTKIDDENLSSEIFLSLENIGFKQYEISNFAKDGFECNHNKGYWKYNEYIGIGSGAVGRVKNKRYYPTKDVNEYIINPIFKEYENLTQKDIKIEKILLGLRSNIGINKEILTLKELEKVNVLIQENKIFEKENFVFNKDFLISDELALFICD